MLFAHGTADAPSLLSLDVESPVVEAAPEGAVFVWAMAGDNAKTINALTATVWTIEITFIYRSPYHYFGAWDVSGALLRIGNR